MIKRLVLPIGLDGVASGPSLEIFSHPNEGQLKFMITINMPPVVWRVCFDPIGGHSNKDRKAADGVPLGVRGPHHHPWPQNRRFYKSAKRIIELKNALPLPPQLTGFAETLEWFCAQTNIELPPTHAVQLPLREMLI